MNNKYFTADYIARLLEARQVGKRGYTGSTGFYAVKPMVQKAAYIAYLDVKVLCQAQADYEKWFAKYGTLRVAKSLPFQAEAAQADAKTTIPAIDASAIDVMAELTEAEAVTSDASLRQLISLGKRILATRAKSAQADKLSVALRLTVPALSDYQFSVYLAYIAAGVKVKRAYGLARQAHKAA